MRTYTVRSWDADAGELTLDFVHHGDKGLAGPWAAAARPGDVLYFSGPGGGYTPDPGADWHLLAGDESALPAIAAALERLPPDAAAYAFIEFERVGAPLVRAVGGLDFPAGAVHAFVHGEAGFVRELRRLLRNERGIPLEQLSISGYWRTASTRTAGSPRNASGTARSNRRPRGPRSRSEQARGGLRRR